MLIPSTTSRRRFLGTASAAALAACAPAASPAPVAPAAGAPPAAPQPDDRWRAEWDRLVSGAKQEGKLALHFTGAGGPGYRQIGEAFEAAFPGISVDVTTLSSGSLFVPRLMQERQAGVFTWDITVQPIDFVRSDLLPQGAIDPLRPALIHPDVLAERSWVGGFENAQMKLSGQSHWGFGFSWTKLGIFWINTDLVKDGELKSVRDLLDPKWKGRMTFSQPELSGDSFHPATAIRLTLGEPFLKQLFVDQQPVFNRDRRQSTEALIRGQTAISLAPSAALLAEFKAAGLAKNVKTLDLPEATTALSQGLWLLNRPPHPNAAKLFANWFLTKEGQSAYTKLITTNSRRTDVAPGDPEFAFEPGRIPRFQAHDEAYLDETLKTRESLKALLAR